MHWITVLFLLFCVLAAGFSAHVAWRSRRDADNWVIDPEAGGIRFQNWTELAFAALICAASLGVIAFALLA